MASFSPNQQLFAAALAKTSGLDPRTIETWMAAEEPPGAKSGYGGTQDWLNVGITDSGPKGQNNNIWQDPAQAGTYTGKWLKGQWNDPGFGTASSGIQGIAKTAGQSPQQQLAAIANSGWASSGYGGAQHLISLMNQVTGGKEPNLPATADPVATAASMAPGYKTFKSPMVNQGGTVFDTLATLEQGREALTGQTQPDAIEQGWQALGSLINPVKVNPTTARLQTNQRESAVLNQALSDGANAPPGAQKILNMAMKAIGGPYSQANHSSAFTGSAAQLKSAGTDCSGFVSWLMGPDGLGIWKNALTTVDIPRAPGIQTGQGKNITIWNNPLPGNSGHVFIQIGNRFFQSAGGGLGISSISPTEAQSMIKSGDNGAPYYPLHPKGY